MHNFRFLVFIGIVFLALPAFAQSPPLSFYLMNPNTSSMWAALLRGDITNAVDERCNKVFEQVGDTGLIANIGFSDAGLQMQSKALELVNVVKALNSMSRDRRVLERVSISIDDVADRFFNDIKRLENVVVSQSCFEVENTYNTLSALYARFSQALLPFVQRYAQDYGLEEWQLLLDPPAPSLTSMERANEEQAVELSRGRIVFKVGYAFDQNFLDSLWRNLAKENIKVHVVTGDLSDTLQIFFYANAIPAHFEEAQIVEVKSIIIAANEKYADQIVELKRKSLEASDIK